MPRHFPNVTRELRCHEPSETPGVCSRAIEEIEWQREQVESLLRFINHWPYCTNHGARQLDCQNEWLEAARNLSELYDVDLSPYTSGEPTP